MTTYNGEKFLREQIDSILAQTIQAFELVVCDDCSSDSTWSILTSYSSLDSRIKIYRNEKNLGYMKNFEKAMGLCKGDYIALSDQDDIWMPNHLEVLKDLIGNKVMACGNSELIDSNGLSLNISLDKIDSFDYVPVDWKQNLMQILFFRNPYRGAEMLIRKDFLRFLLPFPKGVWFHDTWVAVLSCLMGGCEYTTQILSKYRIHEDNFTKSRRKKRSKWKELYKNIIHQCTYDRLSLIDGLFERIPNMNAADKHFLNNMRHHVSLDYSKIGRIKNLPFRIRYFRTIYSCK
ncbi:MAG: glycosyltransferase family 2 protein [Prevotella sp.]|nr:glycosyltransferase family 2 protein [Prevotella sp.]